MANKIITQIDIDGSTKACIRATHAYIGTCSTAAGTAAKTVTISPSIDFLEAGVRITIYMSNANTAANPTLSINNGTAKNIKKGASNITAALLIVGYHDLVYDGSAWQHVGSYINTTYTKLSTSAHATNGSYIIKGAGNNTQYYLRGDGEWAAPTNTTYETLGPATAASEPCVVKSPSTDTSYILRGDGEWVAPSDTTYSKLSTSAHATNGSYVVKGPGSNTQYYLRGDGEWATPANTTYTKLSTSAHATNGSYIIKGAGSNTQYYLRGDGEWATPANDNTTYQLLDSTHYSTDEKYVIKGPGVASATSKYLNGTGGWSTPPNDNTTYARISASNTTTNASYTVPGAGSNTAKFLRGDGSWQTPSNTTYANVSASNTTTNGSYTVPGAGANTGYFLRGDGSWVNMSQTTVGGSNIAAAETLNNIFYEVWSATSSNQHQVKFKDSSGNFINPANLTNGTIYNFVFRSDLGGSSERYVMVDGNGANALSFYWDENLGTDPWLSKNKYEVFPTNMVVSCKKFANGLIYLGPNKVFDLLSSSNTYTQRGHLVKGAGANTGYFLRGDGTWQPVSGGITYTVFSTGIDGLVPGPPLTNTAKFLRGDGSWQTPANTTYAAIGDVQVATTNGSYTIHGPGPIYSSNACLLANGSWNIPFDTFGDNGVDVGKKYVIHGLDDGESPMDPAALAEYFLCANGEWAIPAGGGGGGGTTYSTLSTNAHATNVSYVIKGSGTNTGYFLRGDGEWAAPANTTYAQLSSSAHATNANYVIKGIGTTTSTTMFLCSNGNWATPNLTLSSSAHDTHQSYAVKGSGTNTDYFLRGDGTWQPVSGTAPIAVDEYSGGQAGTGGQLGTVIPVDYYDTVQYTPKYYVRDPGLGYIPALVPTSENKILYAIPVGMDESGHLFIPITDGFMTLLSEYGYELAKPK